MIQGTKSSEKEVGVALAYSFHFVAHLANGFQSGLQVIGTVFSSLKLKLILCPPPPNSNGFQKELKKNEQENLRS